MNPEILNPGALRDIPDDRDFRWEPLGAALPPFDWNQGYDIEKQLGYKLPVDDQNGSTSCGGQAFGKYDAVPRP
jgi:hypothetical protein